MLHLSSASLSWGLAVAVGAGQPHRFTRPVCVHLRKVATNLSLGPAAPPAVALAPAPVAGGVAPTWEVEGLLVDAFESLDEATELLLDEPDEPAWILDEAPHAASTAVASIAGSSAMTGLHLRAMSAISLHCRVVA
jgi:hypothetical protein